MLDELENPGRCLLPDVEEAVTEAGESLCNGEHEITFEKWKSFNQTRDVYGANALLDDKGRRRAFDVTDCPVSRIELGLQNNRGDNGIKSFTPEQSEYYRGRFAVDGNTPTLRKEILRERSKNLAAEGVSQDSQ
jgi:hypothetical protein